MDQTQEHIASTIKKYTGEIAAMEAVIAAKRCAISNLLPFLPQNAQSITAAAYEPATLIDGRDKPLRAVVLEVIERSNNKLTTPEISARVKATGYKLRDVASLHAALAKLAARGKIKRVSVVTYSK